MECLRYPTYAEKLPSEAKQRYRNRLLLICGVDPFCISGKSFHHSNFSLSNLFVSVEKLSRIKLFSCRPFLYQWKKLLRIKLSSCKSDASDLVSFLVLQTRRNVHAVLLSVWGVHIHTYVILRMLSLLYGNLHLASCIAMSNPSSLQLYMYINNSGSTLFVRRRSRE